MSPARRDSCRMRNSWTSTRTFSAVMLGRNASRTVSRVAEAVLQTAFPTQWRVPVAGTTVSDRVPLPRSDSPDGFRDGQVEGGEAVRDGRVRLEHIDLTVELVGGEVLLGALEAVHPGFGAASPVHSFGTGPRPRDGPPAHRRRRMDLPTRRDVRRISMRATAPWVSGFRGLAFMRGGAEGMPERRRTSCGDGIMAVAGRHLQVPLAPLAFATARRRRPPVRAGS